MYFSRPQELQPQRALILTGTMNGPTANEHDADGEDLLRVGVGRHVAEAHAGQAAEGEVQRRHVLVPDGGTRTRPGFVVRLPQLVAQRVQPANPSGAGALDVAYGVPVGIDSII